LAQESALATVFQIEIERETDGRWIAEVPDLSGVLAYGQTRDEAVARVQALALRVLADGQRGRKTVSGGAAGALRQRLP
jgi:predicted RNase H-like HicB family nuclease